MAKSEKSKYPLRLLQLAIAIRVKICEALDITMEDIMEAIKE